MTRPLSPCASCSRHVRETDGACPFCGATRAPPRVLPDLGRAALAGTLALGLVGGCAESSPGPAASPNASATATGEPTAVASTPPPQPTQQPTSQPTATLEPTAVPEPRPVAEYGMPRPIRTKYGMPRP